jgi:RecA-family ATPase
LLKKSDYPPDQPSESVDEINYGKIQQAYGLEPAWSLRQLLDTDLLDNYLVDDCLVELQPSVIAGPSKAMKTTVAVNLTVALASGKPFLNTFAVRKPKRVFLASAESGKATTKKTIIAMANAMREPLAEDGIDLNMLADSQMIRLAWWVPKISSLEMLDYFMHLVDEHAADVVIIDPLYQSLDDQQSSVVLNGQQLATLSRHILKRGATPIMLDHAKRSSQNAKDFQVLELEDISGAGKAEFFRQWMLLSRRSKFEPGQAHEVWLSMGGSAGHASQWALNIDERNPSRTQREYYLDIRSRHEYDQGNREEKKSSKVDKQEARDQAVNERLQRKANDLVTTGMTKTHIAERLRISNQDAGRVIGILLDEYRVKSVPRSVAISGKKYDGFFLSEYMPMGGEE